MNKMNNNVKINRNIKQGDLVIVMNGGHKRKIGRVTSFYKEEYLFISTIYRMKRVASATDEAPGIRQFTPIHRSNVMHYNAETDRGEKVRPMRSDTGKKFIVFKISNQIVPSKYEFKKSIVKVSKQTEILAIDSKTTASTEQGNSENVDVNISKEQHDSADQNTTAPRNKSRAKKLDKAKVENIDAKTVNKKSKSSKPVSNTDDKSN